MSSYTCASCGAVGPAVSALCARCQATRYCNRECQVAHWKSGHKAECKPTAGSEEARQTAVKKPQPQAAAASTVPPAKGKKAAPADATPSASSAPSRPRPSASSASPPPLRPITFSLPGSARPSHPLLRVAALPGKGRGFLATQAIAPGTLLFREAAVYAHSEGCAGSDAQRAATLAALTKVMLERYPQQLAQLAAHKEHELPADELLSEAPAGLSLEAWHDALARVDCNQFASARGMMCAPTVSICNHSCYPNADLIIREVTAPAEDATADAAASDRAAAAPRTIEQASLYAIQPIAAGEEVTLNYLGSDSLCRWYAPSMIRQESFQSQWQFECACARCKGAKASAIDKSLAYAAGGMDEELEKRYTDLVLAEDGERASSPVALLQLYRDLYRQFGGDQFWFHYILHQIRTRLIFMPAAFDERLSKGATSSSSSSSSSPLRGESEFLQLIEHHLQTLASNLLNPPLHSIKPDTLAVVLRACDHVGAAWAERNAGRGADGQPPAEENEELRRKVVKLADECDPVYFEEPVFQELYPDTFALLKRLAPADRQ